MAGGLAVIRKAHQDERSARLAWQEQQADQARGRLKLRKGFATLTGDQSHHVLRPITDARTVTSAEAVAPTLLALRDPFLLALRRAEDLANERLDELLGDKKLVVKVDLGLHKREVGDEREVEALVNEVRERLLDQLKPGVRMRLV